MVSSLFVLVGATVPYKTAYLEQDLDHFNFVEAHKGGCPGVPVHEGIPIVLITIHGVMTQFVNVSFFCVPVHEDTTQ